jgi:hypothetical protein
MITLKTDADIDRFRELFGTRRNRWLANRLGLSGKGSEKLANDLSCYVWNRIAIRYCTTDVARGLYKVYVSDALNRIYKSPCFNPHIIRIAGR